MKITNDRIKCISLLVSLIARGWKVIGYYNRDNNYIYVKKNLNDKVATPMCLNEYEVRYERF